MRELIDPTNAFLQSVLETLIDQDIKITVREIARRHPLLKNASDFTRNKTRMALIANARRHQIKRMSDKFCTGDERGGTNNDAMFEQCASLLGRDPHVKALVAACSACIQAVWRHGGSAGLERYWTEYEDIARAIRDIGAMPPAEQVTELRPK